MRFVRKHPRIPVHCPAMMTPRGAEAVVGDVIDLSVRGAAIVVASSLPPKTPVTLLLDPESLPELARALPSLAGTVISTRRTPDGTHRLGVRFLALGGSTAVHLGRLCDALISEALTPRIEPERVSSADGSALRLGSTPEGRERLFQLAVERLGRGEHALAREAAVFALKADTMNVHYRALVHRVNAEEAIAVGSLEKARRELGIATSLLPHDEELRALAAQAASAQPASSAKKGFFAGWMGKKKR